MPQDTIKIVKTSTISTKASIEKTTVIETINKQDTDYIAKSMDFISSITWPIVILILLLSFRKKINQLLLALIEKIKSSDKIDLSTNGISLSSSKIELDRAETNQKENTASSNELDDMSRKILSTLWTHQLEYDPLYNTRWTFTLGSNHPHYSDFVKSSQILRIKGFVTIALTNGQIFLTNSGIKFCDEHRTKLGVFSFFKNQ